MLSLVLMATLAAAPAGRPTSLAVLDLQSLGVAPELATLVSEAVAQEARKLQGFRVMAMSEIRTLISMEQQRQLSGCTDTGCMAELGGALGAQRLLSGTLGRVGDSWMFSLKVIDTTRSRVEAQASERILGGRGEEFLDAVGPLFERLFPAVPLRAGEVRGVVGRAASVRNPLLRPLAWGFAGGTVALAAGGVGFGLAAKAASDDLAKLNAEGMQVPVSGAEARRLASAANDRALVANVLYGVAGAAAITSVVLFIASAGSSAPPPSVAVTVQPVPGGAAALVSGEF